METQKSITDWQIETFGEDTRIAKTVVLRTFEEMVELCHAAGLDPRDLHDSITDIYGKSKLPNIANIAEELADVSIMLNGTASCYNVNLQEVTDLKMSINRNRKWYRRPDGHLQHKDGE